MLCATPRESPRSVAGYAKLKRSPQNAPVGCFGIRAPRGADGAGWANGLIPGRLPAHPLIISLENRIGQHRNLFAGRARLAVSRRNTARVDADGKLTIS